MVLPLKSDCCENIYKATRRGHAGFVNCLDLSSSIDVFRKKLRQACLMLHKQLWIQATAEHFHKFLPDPLLHAINDY